MTWGRICTKVKNPWVSQVFAEIPSWGVKSWNEKLQWGAPILGFSVSNSHSPANLENLSTPQKFANFGKFEYSPKLPFSEIFQTRQTRIRQNVTLRSTCQTQIRQNIWQLWRIWRIWLIWRVWQIYGE